MEKKPKHCITIKVSKLEMIALETYCQKNQRTKTEKLRELIRSLPTYTNSSNSCNTSPRDAPTIWVLAWVDWHSNCCLILPLPALMGEIVSFRIIAQLTWQCPPGCGRIEAFLKKNCRSIVHQWQMTNDSAAEGMGQVCKSGSIYDLRTGQIT